MKKVLLTLVLSLFFGQTFYAQDNLVFNPSFEEAAIEEKGIYPLKKNPKVLKHWFSPLKASPLLIAEPELYVPYAHSGKNALGLTLGSFFDWESNNYITGSLKSPLRRGQTYCVCFSLILHRTSKWAASDVGVLFSHDKDLVVNISDPKSLTANLYAESKGPLYNTMWKTYCGYYTASGGELFINFGKFGNSKSISVDSIGAKAFPENDQFQKLAFYQLDDLAVVALDDEADCVCAEKPKESKEQEVVLPPYLFALDASGSMAKEGLFDSLRINLISFLHNLPDGSPISAVTFASASKKLFAGKKDADMAEKLNQLLLRTKVHGSTKALLGLRAAYDSWPTEVADSARLVFISDGEFRVTPSIIDLVKGQYEAYGRKIILIQIGSKASGLNLLAQYLEAYIHTTKPELGQVIFSLRQKNFNGAAAEDCSCDEEYPAKTNYHFIVDYSSSMREENPVSLRALNYLYDRVPDTSFVSVTLFKMNSERVYAGLKSELDVDSLAKLMSAYEVTGGTWPQAGVNTALEIAQEQGNNYYNAFVIVTDLENFQLSAVRSMCTELAGASQNIEMGVSVLHFYIDPSFENTVNSEFDFISQAFISISKQDFEDHLFNRDLAKCDYRSVPYHRGEKKSKIKLFLEEAHRKDKSDVYEWE